MAADSDTRNRRRAVRLQLHDTVVGIELTLISIIQGLALSVLAASAVQPLIGLQWEVWPYIATGLLTVLIFWSRSLVHTLSFIGWPLEFGHTFIYFGATLVEAVALSQVSDPAHWFALNAVYAAIVWGLSAYDLRLVRQRVDDFDSDSERALLADIIHDQRVNIAFVMPASVAFQAFAWWLVHAYPKVMLTRRWHLLLIGLTLVFSVNYLRGGVQLLRRRQEWIVDRNAHALAED